MKRVAVVTSAVSLVDGFIARPDLHRRIGIEVPLVVRTHPSMRLADRQRDLQRDRAPRAHDLAVARGTSSSTSHWRAVQQRRCGAMVPGFAVDGQRRMQALATDDPSWWRHSPTFAPIWSSSSGIAHPRASLAAIADADVERPTRAIRRSAAGMPPFFWEIHAGRDSATLTPA